MVPRGHLVLPLFLLALGLVLPAHADPITVTFTAFPAAEDAVNTGPSTGFFTFDSSLIPTGGGAIRSETGLGATDINFFWGNTLWTTANADIGDLVFSPSGGLLAWGLGGRVNHLHGLIVGPPSAVVDDFLAFASAGGHPDGNLILYINAGAERNVVGRIVSNSLAEPVPEPSTLLLLATGSALIGRAARWRRRIGE